MTKLHTFQTRYFDTNNKLVMEEFILAENIQVAREIADQQKNSDPEIDTYTIQMQH